MIRLPAAESGNNSNGHIFYITTRSFEERNLLINYLKQKGIWSVFHYVSLHSSPAGIKYCQIAGTMRVTDDISDRVPTAADLLCEMRQEDVELV